MLIFHVHLLQELFNLLYLFLKLFNFSFIFFTAITLSIVHVCINVWPRVCDGPLVVFTWTAAGGTIGVSGDLISDCSWHSSWMEVLGKAVGVKWGCWWSNLLMLWISASCLYVSSSFACNFEVNEAIFDSEDMEFQIPFDPIILVIGFKFNPFQKNNPLSLEDIYSWIPEFDYSLSLFVLRVPCHWLQVMASWTVCFLYGLYSESTYIFITINVNIL